MALGLGVSPWAWAPVSHKQPEAEVIVLNFALRVFSSIPSVQKSLYLSTNTFGFEASVALGLPVAPLVSPGAP